MHTKELGALAAGESKKLDRKKLPKPSRAPPPAAASTAAASPASLLGGVASPAAAMEAAIAPIWAEMLGLVEGHFDRDDSFFDLGPLLGGALTRSEGCTPWCAELHRAGAAGCSLTSCGVEPRMAGGHSLLASKLVAAISSRLAPTLSGRTVTVLDLFDAPSLALLAAALAPAAPPTSDAPRLGLPPPRPGRVDLAIIGAAGKFPGASSVDGLWTMLQEGRDALRLWTPAELVAKGVDAQVGPHGPRRDPHRLLRSVSRTAVVGPLATHPLAANQPPSHHTLQPTAQPPHPPMVRRCATTRSTCRPPT